MTRLVLATRSAHKIDEISAALARSGVELVGLDAFPGLPEELEEHGQTFEENALEKARFVHAALGLPVVADDSGIEVMALGGAPGVHSKRWTPEGEDEANNARMLRELDGVADRRARYRCVLAVVAKVDGRTVERTLSGTCTGTIAHAPRGGFGFGYDPLFLPDEAPGRTMAELSMAEKNAISHRGRAVAKLPALLRELGVGG